MLMWFPGPANGMLKAVQDYAAASSQEEGFEKNMIIMLTGMIELNSAFLPKSNCWTNTHSPQAVHQGDHKKEAPKGLFFCFIFLFPS